MFRRSRKVEISRTPYDNARDYLAPALGTAKESGTHALQAAMAAMVPVVAMAAPAVAAAKHKGTDLLHSDAAQEAKERAALMMLAAKGETLGKKRRRWPLVIAFFAIGSAVGAAITNWLKSTADTGMTSYAEDGHAGPKVDLTHPLTESEPEPVHVLDEDSAGTDDYSDPKATF